MNIIEALAIQQPAYYKEFIEPTVRFYIQEPENYFGIKPSKFKKLREQYGLRLPFEDINFYYKEVAVVHLKELEQKHPALEDTAFFEDGCIMANIVISNMGEVVMFPFALGLHPTKNIVMPVQGDDLSFSYNDLSQDIKKQIDNLAMAIAYTILTLAESWTEYVDEPVQLNKKRSKAGKPPIQDYHILHLSKRKVRKGMNAGSGSHASPGQHFRRGHFRRYQSGKIVWVRDTIVGKEENGIIVKEYRL